MQLDNRPSPRVAPTRMTNIGQARFTFIGYFVLGGMLLLEAFFVLITAVTKAAFTSKLAERLVGLIYNSLPPVQWIWNRLPAVPWGSWYLAFLSTIGFVAIFSTAYGLYLVGCGGQLRSYVKDAQRQTTVDNLVGGSGKKRDSQSVSSILAGGSVSINQTISHDPKIRDWDKGFSKSLLGLIVIGAVGGFLSIVAAKIAGY